MQEGKKMVKQQPINHYLMNREQIITRLEGLGVKLDQKEHPDLLQHPVFAGSVHANKISLTPVEHTTLDFGRAPQIGRQLYFKNRSSTSASPEEKLALADAIKTRLNKQVFNPQDLKPQARNDYFVHGLDGLKKVLVAIPECSAGLHQNSFTPKQEEAYKQLLPKGKREKK